MDTGWLAGIIAAAVTGGGLIGGLLAKFVPVAVQWVAARSKTRRDEMETRAKLEREDRENKARIRRDENEALFARQNKVIDRQQEQIEALIETQTRLLNHANRCEAELYAVKMQLWETREELRQFKAKAGEKVGPPEPKPVPVTDALGFEARTTEHESRLVQKVAEEVKAASPVKPVEGEYGNPTR